MIKVSIIIPVYNEWQLTKTCLISLAKYTNNVHVYVINNGSSDETNLACPTLGNILFGSNFHYISFDTNHNFGPACNTGAYAANTDYILFLNNDTEVSYGWLPPLVEALDSDPYLAGVGSLLIYPDSTVQHLGVTITPDGNYVNHLYNSIPATIPLVHKKRKFKIITAACLLLHRKNFIDIGGFFNGYKNGLEDVELCLRLTEQGKYMMCIPESVVIHKESKTPGRKNKEAYNTSLFFKRNNISFLGDMDYFLQQDGYTVDITPSLWPYPTIHKSKQYDLLKSLSTPFNPLQCFDLLKEEPFWLHGRHLLVNWLEKNNEVSMALTLMIEELNLCKSLNIDELKYIITLCNRLGIDSHLFQQKINSLLKFILNKSNFLGTLKRIQYILNKTGRYELLKKYNQAAIQAQIIRNKIKTTSII